MALTTIFIKKSITQLKSAVTGPRGPGSTDPGTSVSGDDGWSPIFSVVTDGQRRVLQVTDWAGGAGTKPAVGSYLGAGGFVATVAAAVDIRGGAGAPGNNGWSPVFAVVADGVRRVLQVTDWAGGAGTKPAVGSYLGTSGFVATVAAAVDVRGDAGSAGTNGWSPIFAVASDGLRRVLQLIDWTGGTGTKPAVGSYLGAGGFVATAAAAVDVRGIEGLPGDDGLSGWTSVLAVVADGERRVFQVVDWVGGTGVKPTVGLYVGSTGLVSLIASAVDIRGAAGTGGTGGGGGYSLSQLAIDVNALESSAAAPGDFDLVLRPGVTPQPVKVPSVAAEVAMARGTQPDLYSRFMAVRNGPPAYAIKDLSGRFFDNLIFGSTTNGSYAANRMYLGPYTPSMNEAAEALGMVVQVAGTAGAKGRVVIYEANTNGRPTNLIYSGVTDLLAESTGIKLHEQPFTFQAGKLYWLGVHAGGASFAVLSPTTSGNTPNLSTTAADGGGGTYNDALFLSGIDYDLGPPLVFPTFGGSTVARGNAPVIRMRRP